MRDGMFRPLLLAVISRTRSLNRLTASGVQLSLPPFNVKPRKEHALRRAAHRDGPVPSHLWPFSHDAPDEIRSCTW
jgi:hypothetical protein